MHVGDLGSGSDYTPFLQHIGVPSTDIGSDGPYGVYHSAFDDFAWFMHNADPDFVYLQQMARVLGLEAVRMADADVLPYDYVAYAQEISSYLDAARETTPEKKDLTSLDFAPAQAAADRLMPPRMMPIILKRTLPLIPTRSTPRCARLKPTSSLRPDFRTGPGTVTPSMRPVNTPATPLSSFPASTRPSTPTTRSAPASN